jgi:hypothetical protein
MSKRSVIVLVVALVAAAIVAVAVAIAATGQLGSQVDHQRAVWRDTPVSTSSTSWQTIPGLSFAGTNRVCAHNEVSAQVSLTLQGATVFVRVLLGNAAVDRVMNPPVARFVPGATPTSHSYTFVGNASGFEADDRQTIQLQWRSASGAAVTLRRGDLNVVYQRGTDC